MHISLDQAIGRQPRLNRVGQSLLNIGSGASAAYSLRSLTGGDPKVVNVRRASDNAEQEFTASGVSSGELVNFVNADGTQYMAFDGVDDDIDVDTSLIPETGDFTLTTTFFIADNPSSTAQSIFGQGASSGTGRCILQIQTGGSAFVFIEGFGALTTGNAIVPQSINTLVLSRSGTTLSLRLNTGTAVTLTESASTPIQQVNSKIGHAYAGSNFEGVITSLSIGSTTWDGTAADATSQGWTVNGTPSTNPLNDGFVETWYDQSGNNNDAIQATQAEQPLIVENGNFLDEVKFDGTDDVLEFTDIDFTSSDFFVNATYAWDGTANSYIVADSDNHWIIRPFSSTGFQSRAEDGTQYNISPTDHTFVSGEFVITSVFRDGNTLSLSVNGSVDDTSNDVTGETFSCNQLGARTGVAYFGEGMKEVIIYDSDQSSNRTAIETNINNYYDIYS